MSAAVIRLDHEAMATRWSIHIDHPDEEYAKQAVQAAFAELDRLENELSLFRDSSDLAVINALEVGEKTLVTLDTFKCIEKSVELSRVTAGAFDPAVVALCRLWKAADDRGKDPDEVELAAALEICGMQHFELIPDTFQIGRVKEGACLDLGGIGKGHALDVMAATLEEEWELNRWLLNAGDSTQLAGDMREDGVGWSVRVAHEVSELTRQASAASGSDVQGAHIIDPRSGRRRFPRVRTWARARDAATADALSTAWMVMSDEEIRACCVSHPEIGAAWLTEEGQLSTCGVGHAN